MFCFFFQAEDGIRDLTVTGVQTCALPIFDLCMSGGDSPQILPDNIQQLQKISGGRPKSLVWCTYIKQGKKVSEGHYEATCLYCNTFWHKGSPQVLEAHLANNCLKVPLEIKQLFLNRVAEKAENFVSNPQNKRRRPNNGTEQ